MFTRYEVFDWSKQRSGQAPVANVSSKRKALVEIKQYLKEADSLSIQYIHVYQYNWITGYSPGYFRYSIKTEALIFCEQEIAPIKYVSYKALRRAESWQKFLDRLLGGVIRIISKIK